ncbi:MAG: PLP-dependent transferase [Candidatus Eremiobacteraeota bacterium]|nr:PLP-dependent transferase [Candidatus Eremiobacteraeota bacterium]
MNSKRPETIVIHADAPLKSTTAVAPPIFQTSTFTAHTDAEYLRIATEARNDRFYTRYGNPNHSQAAAIVAQLEGTEDALIFPSGMAALSAAVMAFCRQGDHVIAQEHTYAGTHKLLEDVMAPLGIECTFVDQTDVSDFARAFRERTRLVMVETPSNPLLKITDLQAVAELARDRRAVTLADNTFATPINQRPVDFGIDIVMHSATKYLGGHSDLLAGVLAGRTEMIDKIWPYAVKLGFATNALDSWLLLRGLRTVVLRVERQNHNAQAIAAFLASHPEVSAVHYPGLKTHPGHRLASRQMRSFGGVVSFELGESSERVEPFIRKLSLITRATSLGGVESMLVHQAAMWRHLMTDEQLNAAGISPTLIRLSTGIEHVDDLLDDLSSALETRGEARLTPTNVRL